MEPTDRAANRVNRYNENTTQRIEVIDIVKVCKRIVDESTTGTTYICEAVCGTDPTVAAWQIQRIVESSNVTTITWAEGNGKYEHIAANRATLNYR